MASVMHDLQQNNFDEITNPHLNWSVLLSIMKSMDPEERLDILRLANIESEEELQQILGQSTSLHTQEGVLMQYPEYRVHRLLSLYVPPIILLLGTFGNAFSFIILRDKAMTRQSTHQILAALAVADTLVLYIGLFRQWLGDLMGFDPRNQAAWLCKIIVMVGYTCSDLSAWLIVVVTVERFIVVCYPLHANQVCVVTRAQRTVFVLTLAFLVTNLHFLWTADLKLKLSADGKIHELHCDSTQGHEFLVATVWPWVDALLYGFGPFVIILIFNVIIIKKVARATSGRLRLQSHCAVNSPKLHSNSQQSLNNITFTASFHEFPCNNNNSSSSSNNGATSLVSTKKKKWIWDSNLRLTVMLLSVSFTFLFTTLPMNVSIIAAAFWNREAGNYHLMSRFHLIATVSELLMYLNHSVNFFLYCATGQKFRGEFTRKVCRKRCTTPVTSDHSQHLFCSRACIGNPGYTEVRKLSDETEV